MEAITKIVSILSSSDVTTLPFEGLKPFWLMVPLQNAIQKTQNLRYLSETTSIILGILDIFLILAWVGIIVMLVFGLARYFIKQSKGKDETKDFNKEEAENKKELKKTLKSVVGLAIVFVAIPFFIMMISGFISIA